MGFIHKHTKGKWKCESNGVREFIVSSEKSIDNILSNDVSFDKQEANAMLIENAPELLECTEMLYNMLNNDKSRNSLAMIAVKSVLEKVGVIKKEPNAD